MDPQCNCSRGGVFTRQLFAQFTLFLSVWCVHVAYYDLFMIEVLLKRTLKLPGNATVFVVVGLDAGYNFVLNEESVWYTSSKWGFSALLLVVG